jgi:DNA replication initiation complex subunit (GINS family)
MEKKKLPKSIRKFIRREKARIRREILGIKEQERLIQEIYQKFFKNQRQSAIAASSKQDTKDKQPAAPEPKASGSALISVKG